MSNFHAKDALGRNFPTKKAFREHVKSGKDTILVDTSYMGNRGTIVLPHHVERLGPSDVIVGPHPTDRRWYANVKNGKVV